MATCRADLVSNKGQHECPPDNLALTLQTMKDLLIEKDVINVQSYRIFVLLLILLVVVIFFKFFLYTV